MISWNKNMLMKFNAELLIFETNFKKNHSDMFRFHSISKDIVLFQVINFHYSKRENVIFISFTEKSLWQFVRL